MSPNQLEITPETAMNIIRVIITRRCRGRRCHGTCIDQVNPWRDARWLPQLHIYNFTPSTIFIYHLPTFARGTSILQAQLTLPPHVLVFVPTISPSCCREPYLTPSEDCCPCTSPSLTRARRLYLARCVLSSFFVSIFIFPFPSSKVRAAFYQQKPGWVGNSSLRFHHPEKRAIKYFLHAAFANSLTLLQILFFASKLRSRCTRELMALNGVVGAGG
jgi:hypothetical protein